MHVCLDNISTHPACTNSTRSQQFNLEKDALCQMACCFNILPMELGCYNSLALVTCHWTTRRLKQKRAECFIFTCCRNNLSPKLKETLYPTKTSFLLQSFKQARSSAVCCTHLFWLRCHNVQCCFSRLFQPYILKFTGVEIPKWTVGTAARVHKTWWHLRGNWIRLKYLWVGP